MKIKDPEVAFKVMKAAVRKQIDETISPEEAVQISYIPLVLMQVCNLYIRSIVRVCLDNQLPYKKEIRELQGLWASYSRLIPMIPGTTGQTLKEVSNEFVARADNDLNVLWYSVNHEILKNHPNLSDVHKELYGYLYCLLAFLDFTVIYQKRTGPKIENIMGMPYMPREKQMIHKIKRVCLQMVKNVPINTEGYIDTAMKIIDNKVASVVLGFVEVKED